MRITLPWPAAPLWPNWRSRHWAPKATAVKRAREMAFLAAVAARAADHRGRGVYHIRVTFTPPRRPGKAADQDNRMAACKAYLDGIADALRCDDSIFRHRAADHLDREGDGSVVVEVS